MGFLETLDKLFGYGTDATLVLHARYMNGSARLTPSKVATGFCTSSVDHRYDNAIHAWNDMRKGAHKHS